jgi:hypothetical protein
MPELKASTPVVSTAGHLSRSDMATRASKQTGGREEICSGGNDDDDPFSISL